MPIVNATATLSANGTSTSTGQITWTPPELPEGASAWDSIIISGTWKWNGKGTIQSVNIGGKSNTFDGVPFSIALDKDTVPPIAVKCIGGNKNATGSNFRWTNLQVEYALEVPVITISTPSFPVTNGKISAKENENSCVCQFTSNVPLSEWEARATKMDVTPGQGIGLLVESGGALDAGQIGEIIVECAELTQGDGEYRISVYGKSTGGVWSE